MAVEIFEYEGGFVVDPESDTKEVFIPSPPTMMTVKINPRPVVIYITGKAVDESYEKIDALKAYAEENKVCFVCPSSDDAEEVGPSYTYVMKNAKKINVKPGELTIQCTSDAEDLAKEAVEYMVDELDAEVDEDEIEVFDL